MGSSYAAGAGIGELAPDTPPRCGRTVNNYARLLAARLRLDLVDVSCGGATTANVLSPWSELPAQIDAVTADTRLVTITIGGNDVNYVRDLIVGMCGKLAQAPAARACPPAANTSEASWDALEQRLHVIAREVRRRAPRSRLVFVDYLRIIPEDRVCGPIPLPPEQVVRSRATFRRLADLTAKVARAEQALLLPAGRLSVGHDACSPAPWAAGFPAAAAPWHPTAAGHAAIAEALAGLLRR
jgi:lysophospholipase L1-like esterase